MLSDNLLSFFIINDNKKISYLLNRLLAIYSRATKRIKLKYFLRYYQKAILSKYLRYKRLTNTFKKKAATSKSISNYKTKINFDSFNMPQYSYSLNKSEPYIFTPHLHNKNIAYLITPCYIMDDDDEINPKKTNKFINKFPKSVHGAYPKKKEIFFRTNSEIFSPNEPFYKTYINTNKNKKFFNDSNNDIFFTLEEEKNMFNNKGRFIDNINGNIKRQFSEKQFPFNVNFKKKNNKINKNELLDFNDKNIFSLGGRDNSKKKILIRNKSDNMLPTKNNNIYETNNRYKDQNFNRKILDNIYRNNYSNNNLRKQEYGFNIKKNNKTKSSRDNSSSVNPLSTKTNKKKKMKNYSIFNHKYSYGDKVNKSRDFLFPNNRSNNELPYNKIFDKNKVTSSSYSIFTPHEKSISFREGPKKGSTTSINNNSNNSNTQSNNIGIHRVSTNYSIGPGGQSTIRDQIKINNNSKIDSKSKAPKKSLNNLKYSANLEITHDILGENPRDSFGKKSNSNSNRISLQSLNDSKIFELAGHCIEDDSSTDNYQMNTVIHNKKQFNKISETYNGKKKHFVKKIKK